MDTCRFSHARSYIDGRLAQSAQNHLYIETADAMAFEQLCDGAPADAFGLGRRWHHGQSCRNQSAATSFGQFEHLRVIAPELVTDAIAKTHPLLLQLFGQTRPVTQPDNAGVRDLQATEQMAVVT